MSPVKPLQEPESFKPGWGGMGGGELGGAVSGCRSPPVQSIVQCGASENSIAVQSFLHHQVQCKQLFERQDKEVTDSLAHPNAWTDALKSWSDYRQTGCHTELTRSKGGVFLSSSSTSVRLFKNGETNARLLCMYTNIQTNTRTHATTHTHTHTHISCTCVKVQLWPIF